MAWIWNPLDKSAGITVNNLNFIFGSAAGGVRTENQILGTGKFYWEVEIVVEGASGGFAVGIATDAHNIDNYIGQNAYSWGLHNNGFTYHNSSSSSAGVSFQNGDVIGFAVDVDNGEFWWAVNNVWISSGDPATGANPKYNNLSGNLYPCVYVYQSSEEGNAVFIDTDLNYSPPSGFLPLDISATFAVEGYVYEMGNPVVRQLFLHDRSDGALMDSTTSSGDGYYYMSSTSSGSHYIVCLDDDAGVDYNDLIIGKVYPVEI